MAIKLPNKVGAWLTDSMLEHIDSKRDYRTRSEYLRMLVEADMAKAPPLKAKCEPKPKKTEMTLEELWPFMLKIEPDRDYWNRYMIGYDEAGFLAELKRNAIFTEKLAELQAQKTPR